MDGCTNIALCYLIRNLPPCGSAITPLTVEGPQNDAMPGWPTAEGKKCLTLELRAELVEHLDSQAQYEGCSRAAYLRQLIVRDIERQGPARVVTA